MNKTKTISTLLPITLRAWLAVALLAVVSSFEFIKVIHVDHHHGNEITACTESDEADACHRAVVHSDADAGCQHTQHLEKLVASCEICDALITAYVFTVKPIGLPAFEFQENIVNGFPLEKPYSTSIGKPALRGPPVMS